MKARSIAAMVCGQVQEGSLWYEARLLRAEVQLAPFGYPFQCLQRRRRVPRMGMDLRVMLILIKIVLVDIAAGD
jgi:hypothetical protein